MILRARVTSSAEGEKAALHGVDLVGMDQRLAVESEVAPLGALAREAVRVAEVVVDAVQDIDPIGACREHTGREPRRASARGPERSARVFPWRGRWCPSRTRRAGHPAAVPAAASARTLKIASGVSIIAQMRIRLSALSSCRCCQIRSSCCGVDIFGTRIASGAALAAASRSSENQAVSIPFTRMKTSRLPKPPALTASATCRRAVSLASGATASSRSRMRPSAASVLAFSNARALEPGI